MYVLLLNNILESSDEDSALNLDHVVSEREFSVDDRLLHVLDLVDLDRKSVIGLCDFFAQLLGGCFGPIKVGRAAVFSLIELHAVKIRLQMIRATYLQFSALDRHRGSA